MTAVHQEIDPIIFFKKFQGMTFFRSLNLMVFSLPYDCGSLQLSEILQVAASLFAVHVMARLAAGDTGSLSISLIDKIRLMYKQVCTVFTILVLC